MLFRVLLFLVLISPLTAQDLVPPVPGAVLMDYTTGRLLFQKNPDWADAPASLTKLMTLHLAWKDMEAGIVKPEAVVPIKKEVLALVPPGSSLMFLAVGQSVKLSDLVTGLAVDSGNDAGLVLAESFLAGSQAAFVARMNREAAMLGLTRTKFYDAFGYSPLNTTTALDLARFSRLYLQMHPQAIALVHRVRQFTWAGIEQENRNGLLTTYPGADGLKTGFIEESGYNLAATAVRGNQRLIAILLGVQGRNTAEGSRIRSQQAAKLLDFGFQNYPLSALTVPILPPVRVWYTQEGSVEPKPESEPLYPLSASEKPLVTSRVDLTSGYLGPFNEGAVLGKIVWSREGKTFYQMDLVSSRTLRPAPWWQAIADGVTLFFQTLFGGKAPVGPLIQ